MRASRYTVVANINNKGGNELNESVHIKEKEGKIITKKNLPKARDAPSRAPAAAASWCYSAPMMVVAVHIYCL